MPKCSFGSGCVFFIPHNLNVDGFSCVSTRRIRRLGRRCPAESSAGRISTRVPQLAQAPGGRHAEQGESVMRLFLFKRDCSMRFVSSFFYELSVR